MTDGPADEVLVSSISFKVVPTTKTGIPVGLLIYTRLGNNKTYKNVRCRNSKFSHFVAFTSRLNGLLLPRRFVSYKVITL